METILEFFGRFRQNRKGQVKPQRQLWWIDNKVGGYDGYELEPGGKLYLLNWDLFTGIRWEMSKEGLYTEMVYKGNGNVLKKTSQILSLTDQEMVLKTVTSDNEFIDKYIKIAYGTVADKYYGHYTNGESYVQVIPVYEHQFQIVFSEHDKASVAKYFGYVNAVSLSLEFEMDGKKVVLNHEVEAEMEELTVLHRKYYRPVM